MDSINPEYYKAAPFNPRPLECIDFVRYMCFSLGSAFKYIWRANSKDDYKQELEKAKWYINDYKAHSSDCSNDNYLIVAMRELIRPLVDSEKMTRRQILLGLICLSPHSPKLLELLDECILNDPAYIDEETSLDSDLVFDLS